jgi:twitching motility two-component system response regulator PilG
MTATLLVVEDDPRCIRLMELILGSRGYQTVVAKNGEQALALIEARRFDLVVLDLMLPQVDGFEVLRHIREDPELADVPIVITSATADPTSKQGAADLGADAYVTKPFRKAELLDTIESLVSGGAELSPRFTAR